LMKMVLSKVKRIASLVECLWARALDFLPYESMGHSIDNQGRIKALTVDKDS